jgi:hypothetical protein
LKVERHHPLLSRLVETAAEDSDTAENLKEGVCTEQDLVNSALIVKNSMLHYSGLSAY